MTTEIWYEIEYSVRGANDWFSANASADTIEKIRQKLAEMAAHESGQCLCAWHRRERGTGAV